VQAVAAPCLAGRPLQQPDSGSTAPAGAAPSAAEAPAHSPTGLSLWKLAAAAHSLKGPSPSRLAAEAEPRRGEGEGRVRPGDGRGAVAGAAPVRRAPAGVPSLAKPRQAQREPTDPRPGAPQNQARAPRPAPSAEEWVPPWPVAAGPWLEAEEARQPSKAAAEGLPSSAFLSWPGQAVAQAWTVGAEPEPEEAGPSTERQAVPWAGQEEAWQLGWEQAGPEVGEAPWLPVRARQAEEAVAVAELRV